MTPSLIRANETSFLSRIGARAVPVKQPLQRCILYPASAMSSSSVGGYQAVLVASGWRRARFVGRGSATRHRLTSSHSRRCSTVWTGRGYVRCVYLRRRRRFRHATR